MAMVGTSLDAIGFPLLPDAGMSLSFMMFVIRYYK
jgi:hypothetical protein